MNEFQVMKDTPRALFDYYIEQITNGIPLTIEQLIKFEYLKTLFITKEE